MQYMQYGMHAASLPLIVRLPVTNQISQSYKTIATALLLINNSISHPPTLYQVRTPHTILGSHHICFYRLINPLFDPQQSSHVLEYCNSEKFSKNAALRESKFCVWAAVKPENQYLAPSFSNKGIAPNFCLYVKCLNAIQCSTFSKKILLHSQR